jgi:hypothetical protein
MERRGGWTRARSLSGVSSLAAVLTFLILWSGVTLLLTDPQGPRLPLRPSDPRGLLVSLLLFWLPTCTGSLACLSGLIGLSTARGQEPCIQRRALIGILLGLTPICLATAWLGWVLFQR